MKEKSLFQIHFKLSDLLEFFLLVNYNCVGLFNLLKREFNNWGEIKYNYSFYGR